MCCSLRGRKEPDMTKWLNKNNSSQRTLQRLRSLVFRCPCSWTTVLMRLYCHYAFTVCAYFLSTRVDPLVVMRYQKYMACCISYEHFQFCSWFSLTDSTLHTTRNTYPTCLLSSACLLVRQRFHLKRIQVWASLRESMSDFGRPWNNPRVLSSQSTC